MKAIYHLIVPSLLLTSALSTPIHAEGLDNNAIQEAPGAPGAPNNLAQYLLNLGAFMGYNIQSPPANPIPSSPLTDPTITQSLTQTLIGSIPVNSSNAAFMSFVPNTSDNINTYSNATFTNPAYNVSNQNGSVTINPLIDQLPYQADPVSQAILNILETPDYSFCMDTDGVKWTGGPSASGVAATYPNCSYLYGDQITNRVISMDTSAPLPSPTDFFSSEYNQQFLGQLNSNTLIAPLLYTTPGNGPASSNPSSTPNALPAQNQAQEAANFIRYASGSVVPLSLPSLQVYNTLYSAATTGTNVQTQATAQATLSTYLASLRVSAAQSSVGFSNLYYMLSRRMPQNVAAPGSKDPSLSSQALSEFKMATWRIQNSDQSTNTPWLAKINTAPSATVEREIATLLAEINYQLYLTRQQEERMLLTNTMLLLLNTHAAQPSASALATSQKP